MNLIERISDLRVNGFSQPLGEVLLMATEGNRRAKKALAEAGVQITTKGVLLKIYVNPHSGDRALTQARTQEDALEILGL